MFQKSIGSLTLIGFILTLVSTSFAAGRLSLGGKAGASIANQSYTYASDDIYFGGDWRMGLTAGAFVEQSMLPYLSARLEVLYVEKGFTHSSIWTDEFGNVLGTYKFRARVNDLSINLLARAATHSASYLLIGPRLDITLSSSNDYVDPSFTEFQEKYKSTVFGLTFGLGQELSIAPGTAIFLEGQYQLDLGKLYSYTPQGEDKITTLKSVQNKAFVIATGVRF